MSLKDDHAKVLVAVQRAIFKLNKTETLDKSRLGRKSLLLRQIKEEKEENLLQDHRGKLLADVTKGDHKLRKTETVDQVASRRKSEIGRRIKAEKDEFQENRSKVLSSVVGEHKLKKN